MKKLSLLLIVALIISLASCGESEGDEKNIPQETEKKLSAEEVEALIETMDSWDVYKVEAEYEKLEEEEKEKVKNYDEFLDNEKRDKANKEFFSCKNDGEDDAEDALKERLKNPESLQIHETDVQFLLYKDKKPIYAIVGIEYSAQNGFGGYNRDVCYIFVSTLTGKCYEFCKSYQAAENKLNEMMENGYVKIADTVELAYYLFGSLS